MHRSRNSNKKGKAMELFKLLGTISIDNNAANQAIETTTGKATDAAKDVKNAFDKIGSAAATGGKILAGAGIAIGGAFIAAVEGTREYRVSMGKLETAFSTSGHSAETAQKTFGALNSVLGDTDVAVEASSHLAELVDNEKDMQTWTDICTGVFAKFGDSIPIESLTESANEVAKNGQLTGGLVDAIVWAGESEEEFQAKLDACSTEQERQQLITKTLNGIYKESAQTYKENNKELIEAEKANQRVKDAIAKLGEVGEPIMTAIKNAIAGMAESALPKLEDLIQKFKDAGTWIKDNEEKIKAWAAVIAGVIVTIAAFTLIVQWGTIMSAAAKAISTVRSAMLLLNATMLANPVGLVIAAIAGLVAAFVLLWNNCEGFREFWIDLWEVIKLRAKIAWDAIKEFFTSAWEAIKSIWSGSLIQAYFQAIWNHIKLVFSVVKSVLTGDFKGAWDGIKGIWNNAKTFFSTVWNSISGIFSGVGSWFGSKFSAAWTSVKNAFSGWGSFFGELWDKIKSKFSSIGTAIGTAVGNAAKNGVNSVISLAETAINKGISLINSAIDLANKIPTVNVGKVPKVKFPRMAQGGVLERGQIGFLEGSGAEAVVPLEKNRKWLQALANDLDHIQHTSTQRREIRDLSDLNAKVDKLIALLEKSQRMRVVLDSGALVGELTPAINVKMGDLHRHNLRGNTI